jgi:hypothetical protein
MSGQIMGILGRGHDVFRPADGQERDIDYSVSLSMPETHI